MAFLKFDKINGYGNITGKVVINTNNVVDAYPGRAAGSVLGGDFYTMVRMRGGFEHHIKIDLDEFFAKLEEATA